MTSKWVGVFSMSGATAIAGWWIWDEGVPMTLYEAKGVLICAMLFISGAAHLVSSWKVDNTNETQGPSGGKVDVD